MSKKAKELSLFEISAKIRDGDDFIVKTNGERKNALTAAKVLGANIITRAIKGGFRIIIPSEGEN